MWKTSSDVETGENFHTQIYHGQPAGHEQRSEYAGPQNPFDIVLTALQVSKTPSWPRSWANFSLFYRCILTGMRGPTGISFVGPT